MKITRFLEKFFVERGFYFRGGTRELFYPSFIETERERDDDRNITYYFLSGWQVFPKIKKVYKVFMANEWQNLREIYKVWYKRKVRNEKHN